MSPGFGDDVGRLGSLRIESECASGGGSINDDPCGVIAASGKGGIASLEDDVSIVIWWVGLTWFRRV